MTKKTNSDMFADLPKHIKQYIETLELLRRKLPWMTQVLLEEGFEFRGLSIFHSDRGGYATAVRTYRSDGQPMVCYSNGETPLASFLMAEQAIFLNKMYPEKKSKEYSQEREDKYRNR